LSDSLNDDQVPLHPAVQAELEKRFATYDQDRAAALPWEDVKARLLRES
jgi:putative addiction module component (TIGR02574 family)